MRTAARRASATTVRAALERWFWRILATLLAVAVLVGLFLLVGSGVGGSGDP
jgi:hypothetical protein